MTSNCEPISFSTAHDSRRGSWFGERCKQFSSRGRRCREPQQWTSARSRRSKASGKAKGKGTGKDSIKGKSKGREKEVADLHREKKRCFHCHKEGHHNFERRKFLAEKGVRAVESEKPVLSAEVLPLPPGLSLQPLWCLAMEALPGWKSH